VIQTTTGRMIFATLGPDDSNGDQAEAAESAEAAIG
jgi:hypothetical protein